MKIDDGLLFSSVCEQLPRSKAHLRCDLFGGGDNSSSVEVKRAAPPVQYLHDSVCVYGKI